MLSSGLHGYFSSPSSCFPFSLSITLYCTCGSDALMWRLVAGDPRRAMVSEFGVVYRGALLGIRGPCNQGECLPNIKNMIFHPLDRGFFPALQHCLRLMSCVVNAICHGVSYLNVYMSCCRLNVLSYMCFHSHGLVLDILGMHIDTVVHPLQAKRASSHDHSTTREETNPASSTQNIKNRIRIPSIMLVAFLDPEPVGNGDTAADAQSRQYGNSVWWGEKEEVQDQCY